MPTPIIPQDQWETEFEGPLPNEPGIASALRTLAQRILNRTEWLKERFFGHRSAPVLDHPDQSVTSDKLAPNSVDATKLVDGAVTSRKIADNSISRTKIVDGEVTTEKLANRAVTLQKLASSAFSANPTPNTLALRNAQGAVQDQAVESRFVVLRVNGLYTGDLGNKWVRLVQWTGFQGAHRGLFADLYIARTATAGMGARLRARIVLGSSGNIIAYNISLANEVSSTATVLNAILVQTGETTYELWVLLNWLVVYVSGLVHTEAGSVTFTPYGNVTSIAQDSPPTPIPDGFYLEWNDAEVSQTFAGPGHVVAAGRGTTAGYIRYDNGIQIAWATVTVGSGSWTYPAAFASTPQVLATAQDSVPRLVTITSVSTTAAGVLRTDLSGATQSGTVHLWAIGLWK